MTYLSTYSINLNNWPEKHRAMIVSILELPYTLSPVLLSLLYYAFILNINSSENLSTLYLSMAIMFSISLCIILVFTKEYSYISVEKENNNTDELTELCDKDYDEMPVFVDKTYDRFIPGILHMDTFLLILTTSTCHVAWVVFLTFITSILKSFTREELSYRYTILGPCVALLARLILSHLSDRYKAKISRVAVSLILFIASTLALVLCIFYGDHLLVLTVAYLTTASAGATTACVLVVALCEKFSPSLFNYAFSLGYIVCSVPLALISPLAGYFYDKYATAGVCSGLICFQSFFILLSSCQFICSIFHILSLIK